jgi:hypothetical protein
MMITVSIIGAVIQLQEASAAKPQFCYTQNPSGVTPLPVCRNTMQECFDTQAIDPNEKTKCRARP